MSDEDLSPEEFGLTEKDIVRARIIAEAELMKRQAIESGSEHHLPAMDRLEAEALDIVGREFREGE